MNRIHLFRRSTPILAVLALLALSCSHPARAEAVPPRLAVIDYDRLLLESEPGKKIIAPLDALMKEKKTEAQAMEEELKKIRAKAAEQANTASEQQLTNLQRKFNDKLDDLRHFEAEANSELDKLRAGSLGRFNTLSLPLIQSLGKELGYTMIFQKQNVGLIYLDPSADITNLVIQRLNAQAATGH